MKTSKWYKTLDYFLNKGYVNNGLTIPFLIGLYPKNEIDIRELIISMSNTNHISIQKCNGINEFVFGIFIFESNEEVHSYKSLNNIIILDNSLDDFESIEQLIAFFEDLYNDNIQNELYSKNNNTWTFYNETEIKQIEGLINN